MDVIFQGNDTEEEQKAQRDTTKKDQLRKRLRAWHKRKNYHEGWAAQKQRKDIVKIETLFKMVTTWRSHG